MIGGEGPRGGAEFALQLPEGWTPIPLDPAGAHAAMRERLAGLPADQRDSREARRFERTLRRMVEQVVAAGVILAAVWTELVADDDEAQEDEAGADQGAALLLAVLTVATIPPPSGGGVMTPAVLKVALRTQTRTDGLVPLEQPADVDLPCGPAVRQAWLRRAARGASGPGTAFLLDRFLVTAPGGGAAVVDFQTPNVGLHTELRGLFLQVAHTIEFSDLSVPRASR